ncbi:MAG: UGSC family (seleno)protein [Candidatus Acidiferrales bacterium]
MATQVMSAVLNPEGYRTVIPDGESEQRESGSFSAMAPRLDALNGKTVYLVDTGFGGSGKFLDEMQSWFAECMPSLKTVRRRKSGNVFRDDTKDLWKEIKERGQAAILGVAG